MAAELLPSSTCCSPCMVHNDTMQGLSILADEGTALAAACSGLEALALRSCTLEDSTFLPTLSRSTKLQRLVLDDINFATEAAAASLAALGAPGSLPALTDLEVSACL